MIGIEQKDYNKVSEEIVFEYLMKQYRNRKGKKPVWILSGEGSGDIRVGNKIIEVKGQKWINEGGRYDTFDFVRDDIIISEREREWLVKNPKLFDVYIVYNLVEEEDEEYQAARIAIVKGTDLKKLDHVYTSVRIKTPKNANVWQKTKQIKTNHLRWKIKDLKKKARNKRSKA